jgi:poly-gamma-glutamate capsule biosynthesis protein CapA/YwtB (metallophosphatase superfamily)
VSVFLAGVGDLVVTRPLRHVRKPPDDSLLQVLSRASFTVGNLEGPLTGAEFGPRGERLIRGAPELASDVVAMGVDAVSLANNHAGDPGWEALYEMQQELELAGLVTLGLGADAADAFQPLIQNVHGVELALVAATCVGRRSQHAAAERPGIAGVRVRTRYETDPSWLELEPGIPPRTVTSVEPDDRDRLLRAVRKARELVPFVVVTMHWGVTWAEQPVAYQRELGRELAEAGASVVFGSHSQTLQGVEVHDGVPIFYSLGTFVFNHRGQQRRRVPGDAAVALVEAGVDGSLASARMVLGRLDAEGEPVRAQAERAEVLAELLARSSEGWGATVRLESDTLKIDLR